jgi:hypothetical protein
VDFDVEALFPFLSNTDTGLFNFDSFDDDVFSIPNSASQSDTTIPRFTELNDDEQVETISTGDNETTAGPAPAVVPQVESGKKTRYHTRTSYLMVIGLVGRQQRLSKAATCTDVLAKKGASNVANGDRRYNTASPLSNETVRLRNSG